MLWPAIKKLCFVLKNISRFCFTLDMLNSLEKGCYVGGKWRRLVERHWIYVSSNLKSCLQFIDHGNKLHVGCMFHIFCMLYSLLQNMFFNIWWKKNIWVNFWSGSLFNILGEGIWGQNGQNGAKNCGPKYRNQGTQRKSDNSNG